MNLRAADLNLLVVLDVLLDEAHVSRAAFRLNLSQPAVSSALQRCRELFADPLLERRGAGMARTLRAEALRGPLKTVLGNITELIGPAEVDVAELVQEVRLTMADDPMHRLAGPLSAALRQSAPGLTLVFKPWRGTDAAIRELTHGDAELVISVIDSPVANIETCTLLEERYVVAMREGHPAAKCFDLDAWLEHPHVLVSGRGESRSPIDDALGDMGRRRRVGVVIPIFQLIPAVLRGSDFFATVPSRSLQNEEGLVCAETPIPVEGFSLRLAWHSRNADDPGTRHVAEAIKAEFQTLGSE